MDKKQLRVLAVFDDDEHAGLFPWQVMIERVDGCVVYNFVSQKKYRKKEEAIYVAQEVAEALSLTIEVID